MAITPTQHSVLRQLNLIWVMLWHSFMPTRKRESAKLLWVFLEPAVQLAILILLFSLIQRDAAYGRSFSLFLLSGIVVLQVFRVGSKTGARSIEQANLPRRMPQTGLFNGAVVAMFFELLTAAVYTPVLAAIIWWWEGVDVIPHHPVPFMLAVLALLGLTFGFSLLRGYCRRFLPVVERVFRASVRGLLLISGVFYVPSWLPPEFRDVLWYNPVLHVIELLRIGLYYDYPMTVFSPTYLLGWVFGSVTFGMALVWSVRKKLRT